MKTMQVPVSEFFLEYLKQNDKNLLLLCDGKEWSERAQTEL